MPVTYGKFELPQNIQVEADEKEPNKTKFIIDPFETGFGHTIGNALRRIMLTSLEAPSIVSIRIDGIPHEYTAVDGIIEDMIHIVLNLKGALLRYLPDSEDQYSRDRKTITKQLEITEEQISKAGGQYQVTLQEILGPSNFELVNPDHVIFTVTKPFDRKIDVTIGIGRGYVPAERLNTGDRKINEVILDACFSPVRLVNYHVENTRVGQDTDFDKLILEVVTDGRITPDEALSFATQIAMQHFSVFDKVKKQEIVVEQPKDTGDKGLDELLSKLALKINEIELSVRSTNCLANANIDTIGELVVMPEAEMLSFRNFGKKSLVEIQEKLRGMGLKLGMEKELAHYGINRDNIKEIIEKYLEEHRGTEE